MLESHQKNENGYCDYASMEMDHRRGQRNRINEKSKTHNRAKMFKDKCS